MSKKRNLTPEEQEHRVESNFKNLMEQVDKIYRDNKGRFHRHTQDLLQRPKTVL